MNVKEIVRRVRNMAGDTAVNQFNNETLTDWINTGIRECAVENSLLQKSANQNTVVGQAQYALPTDIYKLHSVTVNNSKIRMVPLNEWEQMSDQDPEQSSDTGKPAVGYIWAGQLALYPAPDSIVQLRINYTADPANLVFTGGPTGDATWENQVPVIPASYHDRLVIYCLAQVALQDDDPAKYESLMMAFKSGVIETKHQGETQEDLYPFMNVSSRDGGFDWQEIHY